MNPICFYHRSDLDGKCSGAIVRIAVPGVELRGINYGEPFPWADVEGREVYMVDFSLQPFSEMIRLAQACSLTWIDHHKSQIEDQLRSEMPPHRGIQKVGRSGCELCWEFFFPGKPVPRSVNLLGRYDVWDNADKEAWERSILPFQWGCRQRRNAPEDPFWDWVLRDDGCFEELTKVGSTLLSYQREQDAAAIKSSGFDVEFEGLRGLAINRQPSSSQLFEARWDPAKYDIMIGFGITPKNGGWTVGLYSTKPEVDCSVIAKRHGGGGHKGAAGYQTKEIPFLPPTVNQEVKNG